MTDEPDWFRADLETDVSESERAGLWRTADALISARPYPRAAFRAQLRQTLAGLHATPGAPSRPRGLWLRVGALATPGIVLFAIVAVGLAGSGPFAK